MQPALSMGPQVTRASHVRGRMGEAAGTGRRDYAGKKGAEHPGASAEHQTACHRQREPNATGPRRQNEHVAGAGFILECLDHVVSVRT